MGGGREEIRGNIDRASKVMSGLIATIISGLSRPHLPLILLESSLVQSCLPVLRAFVNDRDATTHVMIFCLLYPPSAFADDTCREGLHLIDRTAQVPGYADTTPDLAESIRDSGTRSQTLCRVARSARHQFAE